MAEPSEAQDPRDARDDEIYRASHRWIEERTVGVFQQRPEGNPTAWGSGVLLRIADASFLLTARHVLEVAQEALVLIGPMSAPSRFIPIIGTEFKISVDTDTIDIGYARLPDDVANQLAEYRKQFLRLNELELATEPTDGLYSVVGYPTFANTPNYVAKEIIPTPFSYGTYLCHHEVDGFKQGTSIAVAWTANTVRFPDGEFRSMPEVGGISGGGIWLLHSDHGDPGRLDTWSPSRIRLAGIEHRVVRRRWIKGTLIRRVVEMLAVDYPELRASIRVTMP